MELGQWFWKPCQWDCIDLRLSFQERSAMEIQSEIYGCSTCQLCRLRRQHHQRSNRQRWFYVIKRWSVWGTGRRSPHLVARRQSEKLPNHFRAKQDLWQPWSASGSERMVLPSWLLFLFSAMDGHRTELSTVADFHNYKFPGPHPDRSARTDIRVQRT